MSVPLVHPVQLMCCHRRGVVPQSVTLRAYEVYKYIYGAQEARVTGNCRGGFSTGELLVFLYVRASPQSQCGERVNEALTGLKLGK